MQFFITAVKIEDDLTQLLLRNFGVKDKCRDLKIPGSVRQISPQDRAKIMQILEPYNAGADILLEYPQWLLSHKREQILDAASRIVAFIVEANSIYPVCREEAVKRRCLQDDAIGQCWLLQAYLNSMARNLPSDANKLKPFVELIAQEIELLKGWRKSDKFIKKFGIGREDGGQDSSSLNAAA